MARTQKIVGAAWRLKSGLLYAGLGKNYSAALVGPDDATVFDDRDNPEIKAGFYQALFNRPFEKEMIQPCT